ncbi:MAG: hypothetical protein M3394_04610 [Actinomycetota bacterium]|nr:hypothetical protein [Actinomycetota bacterium]
MKRLLVAGALVAFGWLGSPASPAAANPEGDWVCVYVDRITFGVCMGNPLPELLPIRSECWNAFDAPVDQTCVVWNYVPTIPPS